MNHKLLTFNDFSFGFELEGMVKKTKSKQTLKKELDDILDLGVPGNMHNDASLSRSRNYLTFEYSSPVIPFTIENLKKFVKLLDSLPSLDVFTDKTCAFHTHISHKNLSYIDAVWFMAYLCQNNRYKDLLHSCINNYSFYNTTYAEYKFFENGHNYLEYMNIPSNRINFLKTICDNIKYRCIRVHPIGTLEWRGPRTFLNIPSHEKNIKYVKDLYKFISLLNKSRNTSILYNSKKDYITKDDIKNYLNNEIKKGKFEFSTCNSDKYKSLKEKLEKNPLFLNDISSESFKKYKKELIDLSFDTVFFTKIIKKYARKGIPFNNKLMFSNIICKTSDFTTPLLKKMKLSFFKRYINKIASIGGMTYIYYYLKKTGDNPEILEYLKNLSINDFGNPKIRIFTMNVVDDLVSQDKNILLKIIDKDWKRLNISMNWIIQFLRKYKVNKQFISNNSKIIESSPNYLYFFNYF